MSTKRNWRTEPGFTSLQRLTSRPYFSEFGNATEFENAFPILATFPNSGTLLIFFCSFQIQQ